MKGCGPVSWLPNRHFFLIFFACLQNIRRRPPIALGNFCEIPRMTFSAGEGTAGLVDGEVVFRTREMNGGDQPEETVVGLFESRLAGERLPLLDLNKTVSLRISLLDQITFHLKILSYAVFPLQVIRTV
jgi:hypothetical protein